MQADPSLLMQQLFAAACSALPRDKFFVELQYGEFRVGEGRGWRLEVMPL